MERRAFLASGTLAAATAAPVQRARIAAIITTYYRNSHADVFVGNILRGYYWDGKPHTSQLDIAAMYIAQTPEARHRAGRGGQALDSAEAWRG